ncbi:head decoration protein [Paenibacillus anseongense]|uniref:head decoration protein n=1 Tax=Paenibacillus anseongense TaxID=2682845 RepID=UPI002DB7D8E3|nr:head decoration protein [Paenibacillus anseongense]MEC0269066.1 head decoration protein [Paenibacillus anseongense]
MAESLIQTNSVTFDNLIAGHSEIVTDSITLKAGQAYLKGSVIGLTTATPKGSLVDSTKSDGTQTPYGILTDDVDATTADAPGVVYVRGEFNESKLIFGGTDTIATHKKSLRNAGIITRKTKKA